MSVKPRLKKVFGLVFRVLLWAAVAMLGAAGFAELAQHRGEPVNAIWLVAAALSVLCIGYRFYTRYLAARVLQLDDTRLTPAHRHNDGLDYVPTDRNILFGHHFAAIAGAGPLVGPVLAAQMGYLPGTLWILSGAIFAGAVQDLVVLFLSTRRDGHSLGEMIRSEIGAAAGWVASVGILAITVMLLAVLALIVIKALAISPWGSFTVAATLPISLFMGVYLRYLRPGRILEVSVGGFILLLLATWLGGRVAADPEWARAFTFSATQLCWILIGYGMIAAALPVWLLLAPRDYVSTFLKIGTILLLAVSILLVQPPLKLPALTQFVNGGGPVFSGPLFPFLFITITCGAISGFHALVASGTTPKMLDRETHARWIACGGMLVESFVAIMALVAAGILNPAVYFAMNSPAAVIGNTAESAAHVISGWGFEVPPWVLDRIAQDIGETTILSRAGGAPTLAEGMAQILRSLIPGKGMMAFWYHYAILFEALFILTTIDAGTRIGRFMIQDLIGAVYPPLARSESWLTKLALTALCVGGWGFLLYQGVTDPYGGLNTLWPLFGICNQMLAGMALVFASVCLVKMKRERYLWATGLPMLWLLTCTLSAGWQKLLGADPRVSFIAHAQIFRQAQQQGQVLAPAQSLVEMRRIVQNDVVDAVLTLLFVAVMCITLVFGIRAALQARRLPQASAQEIPAVIASS